MQLSKDLMSDFRKIFDSEAQLDIALDVNVVRKRGEHQTQGNEMRASGSSCERNCFSDSRGLPFFLFFFSFQCTTGFWPSSKIIPCIMPKELGQACEKYKRFYLNQHSGHKLEWRYDQARPCTRAQGGCRRGHHCAELFSYLAVWSVGLFYFFSSFRVRPR